MPSIAFFTRPQRLLLVFGTVTALSGVGHGLVWLAAGMPSLVGPVTLRKPIVFGLSIGVLSWSLVWVVRHLRDDRRLHRQTMWLVGLLAVELLLIDMQLWRGVGSHFIVATVFVGAVFQAMGIIILAAAAILGWWTWKLFANPRRDLPSEQLTAARAGMLLLAVGNVIGMALVSIGVASLDATGYAQTTLGPAGNVKLTHAIALHGMQVLPAIALLLATVPDAAVRLREMRRAAAGYALILAWGGWQAFSGRAPESPTLPSGLLLMVGLALLVWPVLRSALAWAAPREGHATGGAAQ
jgi:hypothetical protein